MADLVKTNEKKDKKIGYMNSYILQRIKRNKNFVCCLTGQTGSGKSYSALREGEILDPNFDIDNVCFSPLEFIQLVNGKKKKLKRGSVIIYDEVQVTMSAQDFQSLQAKLINACLQTFRFRGFILFMTSPFFHFVNKSARKLFHSRWETVTIDHAKKQCVMKPFLLQTNQDTGKTYRKYLRVWTKETGVVPYKRMKIGLASEKLRKAYEAKRQLFSNKLNEEIEQSLLNAKEKDKPKERFPQKCNSCSYEWQSPKKRPVKCPNCQKRDFFLEKSNTTTTKDISEPNKSTRNVSVMHVSTENMEVNT